MTISVNSNVSGGLLSKNLSHQPESTMYTMQPLQRLSGFARKLHATSSHPSPFPDYLFANRDAVCAAECIASAALRRPEMGNLGIGRRSHLVRENQRSPIGAIKPGQDLQRRGNIANMEI